MKAITYTNARKKLAQTMESVCEDHIPILITKKKDVNVVMISLQEYESLKETAYLLKSPKNVSRLMESIKEIENNQGSIKEIEL